MAGTGDQGPPKEAHRRTTPIRGAGAALAPSSLEATGAEVPADLSPISGANHVGEPWTRAARYYPQPLSAAPSAPRPAEEDWGEALAQQAQRLRLLRAELDAWPSAAEPVLLQSRQDPSGSALRVQLLPGAPDVPVSGGPPRERSPWRIRVAILLLLAIVAVEFSWPNLQGVRKPSTLTASHARTGASTIAGSITPASAGGTTNPTAAARAAEAGAVLFLPTAQGPLPTGAAERSAPSPMATAIPTLAVTNAPGNPALAASSPTPSQTLAPQVSSTPAELQPPRLVATLAVGQQLCDVAIDGGGHLIVSDDGAEQLLLLDAATHQQLRSFAVENSLCSFALDQSGQRAYVPTWHRLANGTYDSSQLLALNLVTGASKVFAAAHFPTGPYFDTGNETLYVGNTADPSLLALDVTKQAVADRLPLPAKVNRITVAPSGDRLYLASPESNAVLVATLPGPTIVDTLRVGQRPWAIAADVKSGLVAVSSELSGTVSFLDPRTEQVVRVVRTGSHPRNLALDNARGLTYVLNAGDRSVSKISPDLPMAQTSALLPGRDELTGIAVAPKSGQVFVVTKSQIFILE